MGLVEISREGNVATLTMNRPEALNALNFAMLDALDGAIASVKADNEINVVVLTGAGRAFVAGADIAEMRDFNSVQGHAFSAKGNAVFLALERLEKPIIAAVNGFALGGGCELAMACDIRVASESAKFGQPEVGLGITPGFGGTQRLPRLVGTAVAFELLLTGRVINATEALDIGLINSVFPPAELMTNVSALAASIARQPQVAVRQIKQCVRNGLQTDIVTALSLEAASFGLCCSTEDQKDSMTAFMEKRKIDTFKNR